MENSIRIPGNDSINVLLTIGYSYTSNGHPLAYRRGISGTYNYAQLARATCPDFPKTSAR
jgi:hypothetical protein